MARAAGDRWWRGITEEVAAGVETFEVGRASAVSDGGILCDSGVEATDERPGAGSLSSDAERGQSMTRRAPRFTAVYLAVGFGLVGLWLWGAGDLLVIPIFAVVVAVWVTGLVVVALQILFPNIVVPTAAVLHRLGSVVWVAIASDPAGQRLHERVARASRRLRPLRPAGRWLLDRVRPGRGGLRRSLTAGVGLATGLALWRLTVLVGQPTNAIVATDVRIANMARSLSDAGGRALMLGLTNAGGTQIMTAISVILIGGALLGGARRSALLILTITTGSALGVTILKALVGRVRPSLGILVETSTSFPSGHASAGLALALAVVAAWRALGRTRWPILAGFLIPIGLLIGYSRAYLTVHWASDVVGGWLVALLVTSVVLVADDVIAATAESDARFPIRRRYLGLAGVVAAVLFSGAVFLGHDTVLPATVAAVPERLETSDPAGALENLVPFSETLTGRHIEPIGLVIAASEPQLTAAFSAAGWSIAEPPTFRNLLEVYWAGLRGREDLTAPVTPSFFDSRVQDIAIEKPVARSTGQVRVRHHARLWRLPVVLDNGCPVWVATASLDNGVEWTWRTVLPNHHIAPAIDVEQSFLVKDLVSTGRLESSGRARVTEPMMGTNAAGDPWFTDGIASLLIDPVDCGE